MLFVVIQIWIYITERRGFQMQNGFIHLYYGDGKGKTTAAIGLAVRAAGAGKNVLFAQFMKGGHTGEIETLQKIENIDILRSTKKFPFYKNMTSAEKKAQASIHNQMLDEIIEATQNGKYDLIILDEITYPYHWNLIDNKKLCHFLLSGQGRTEIVCTGRNPDTFFLEYADYITEMKCVRHPYESGVPARKGIEF